MPGPEKRPIPKRTYIPVTIDNTYVVLPDAIALTTYPVAERVRIELELERLQKEQQKRAEELQDRKRKAWKARKDAEHASGKRFDISHNLMTNKQIDEAMAAEERAENGPRLLQGYDRPNYNIDLLAGQYANILSFYSALGSPNIMPMTELQVRANPGVAATLAYFGLDNPALTAIQMAAPTGPGAGSLNAAGAAIKAGMNASKPIVPRVISAVGKGVLAGGKALVLNAPRVAANVAVQAVPVAAIAQTYSGPSTNLSTDSDGSSWVVPAALGSAVLGYTIGKYIHGKSPKATTPSSPYVYSPDRRIITWENPEKWASRTRASLAPDLSAEWNAAVGNAAKENAFKDKYGLFTTDKVGEKEVKNYLSNISVANDIEKGRYSGWENIVDPQSYVLTYPTNSLIMWARARNVGRAGSAIGLPVGGYFLFRSPSQSEELPNVILQSSELETPSELLEVPKVRRQREPVTTSTKNELDSLNRVYFSK